MERALQGKVFGRSLLLQALWSYERMQGLGFAYVLAPWLRKLHRGDAEGTRRALLRHADYFNTQPYMASFVLGAAGGLEEQALEGPSAETLRTLKVSTACALAAIGDALFWGALRPFCAAVAALCAVALWRTGREASALWTVLLYLAAYNGPALAVRWKGIALGYEWKERLALALREFPWQAWIRRLRLAGTALALAAFALALSSPSLASGRRWEGAAAFAASALAYKTLPAVSGLKLYAAACVLGLVAAAGGWRP